MINKHTYEELLEYATANAVTLVAVSKTKPTEDIMALYELGQRDFGENYVQELLDKHEQLPKDIRWHFIGHLQSNKVKQIAPFVHLIHGVDSEKLLTEINKQAEKLNRTIACLLQVFIALETTKFGLDETELMDIISRKNNFANVKIAGLMGMATNSTDEALVRNEFKYLKNLFDETIKVDAAESPVLSIGMSGDYLLAIEEGSTMIRIGSLLFGERNYLK